MVYIKIFFIGVIVTSLCSCANSDIAFTNDASNKISMQKNNPKKDYNLQLSVFKFIDTEGNTTNEHVLMANKLNNLPIIRNSSSKKNDTMDLRINAQHQKWQK